MEWLSVRRGIPSTPTATRGRCGGQSRALLSAALRRSAVPRSCSSPRPWAHVGARVHVLLVNSSLGSESPAADRRVRGAGSSSRCCWQLFACSGSCWHVAREGIVPFRSAVPSGGARCQQGCRPAPTCRVTPAFRCFMNFSTSDAKDKGAEHKWCVLWVKRCR